MNLTVKIKKIDGQVLVKLNGEIDAYTAPQLKKSFQPFEEEKKPLHMKVDLSDVSYMDSTGLGVFVGLFKFIRGNEGSLKLTGLSPRLKRLFQITGLAEIMEINTEVEGV
ncbi:anti-sigma factor antagonist [Bacillus sp. FJAT-49736]|uniref:anti-sigma factor antagonist n=1 Tax=Bacillus sp. FJAT-49736 TaxID=2833582 RepID=UPI001BC9E904|nr:anti-sigma factor antagonist [Bacillus sp. FJAT-49736]MBS4175496.1 anti-sigma factor antagonist [Bacillus sp. FJAT-49736]